MGSTFAMNSCAISISLFFLSFKVYFSLATLALDDGALRNAERVANWASHKQVVDKTPLILPYSSFFRFPKFLQMKQLLEKCFPNQLDISGETQEGGAFEVTLLDSGEVLHSKKNGDGYLDTNEKVNRLCGAIKKKLAALRSLSDLRQASGVVPKSSSTAGGRTRIKSAAKLTQQLSESKSEVKGDPGQEDAKNASLETESNRES